MKSRLWFIIALTGLAGVSLALTGCGKKTEEEAGHDHSEHSEEGGEEGGVVFKEGRGLQLSPAIVRALALETVEAGERSVASDLRVTAQVFALAPRPLAGARVPETEAAVLEKATFVGAKLVRLDHSITAATRLADLVFELDTAGPHKIGDFLTIGLGGDTPPVLAVPRSAVLDGATGTFVYVVNGESYLRTPVTLGARSADYVEITDGLYSGDKVVVTPVEQLWLAELRLTKGGGHSH